MVGNRVAKGAEVLTGQRCFVETHVEGVRGPANLLDLLSKKTTKVLF
jgi:hypothetical protein